MADTDAVESLQNGLDPLNQTIKWAACEESFECATVAAPLNWLDPGEDFISLALIRKAGTSDLPPLLVNPGGPGSSGFNWLRDGYESIGSNALRENFQLIGFDPRGVENSDGVTCPDIALKDEVYYGQSPYPFGSDEDIAWSIKVLEDFAASCQEVGFDTSYFNTQQTARDLEMFRVLLAMPKLDYLGFSYGTELGANYAALFPQNVGKMVLDGAVDPTLTPGETLVAQVGGFDNALRNYLADCLNQAVCPFKGNVDDGISQIAGFLAARESKTLPTDFDRELGLSAAISGIIAALYSKESWIYLTQAFAESFGGNGSTMLLLADFYNDRDTNADRYLSNINEANSAISCADSRVSDAEAITLRLQLAEESAVFGKYFQYPNLGCLGWPEAKGTIPLDFSIDLGYGPLVIGTTNDPATPYSEAVSLSQILNGAKLLTFNGEGHTAYGSNSCVDALVESYLRGENLGLGELTCS
ncbi:MAG: alpha/beta hydrolase [Aquiluna sp.]|nr:alpha/beta hydrolase [Aquiluna sp.]